MMPFWLKSAAASYFGLPDSVSYAGAKAVTSAKLTVPSPLTSPAKVASTSYVPVVWCCPAIRIVKGPGSIDLDESRRHAVIPSGDVWATLLERKLRPSLCLTPTIRGARSLPAAG